MQDWSENEKAEAREFFRQVITDTPGLMAETRRNRHELDGIETELKQKLEKREITQLLYDIEMVRINRSRENIRYCLRALQRQRTIAIEQLRKLDEA